MSFAVFAAVLFAALLHATWNAIIKVGSDRFSSIILMTLVQGVIAALLLPWFSWVAPAALAWIVIGGVLHAGYNIFLIRAYEHGDLSQVYPLARGTAPLIVALVGAVWLRELMPPLRVAAVLLIAGGVILMAWRGRDPARASGHGVIFALITACFTAAYTLADGYGARISGSVSSFTMATFIVEGALMLAYALAVRGRQLAATLRPAIRGGGVWAGAMSLTSYWIAIWGFTQAPLAAVAALRETSVLFAVLIAALVLKEKVAVNRWAAAALILAGIMTMRL